MAVPIPVNLVKYLDDPGYKHQDFTLASACTLRARVNIQFYKLII